MFRKLLSATFSYFQLFPAILLIYAGSNKLKATWTSMDIQYLQGLELLTNLFLPIVEIVLAFCLALRPSRFVLGSVTGLFGIYVGYLAQVYWNGGTSCKCMGNGYSNVAMMLGIDLWAISCLLIHPQLRSTLQSPWNMVAIIAMMPMSSVFWINSPSIASAVTLSLNPGPLRTEFKSHQNLPAASNFKGEVVISNRTRKTVEIDEFMISCGCTKFSPQQVSLPAGGSETISLSIDLNKAFKDSTANIARLEVGAGCYDKDLNEIDQVTFFVATTQRPFAPRANRIIHQWQSSSSQNQISIPIQWFSDYQGEQLSAIINGVTVASETTADSIRITLDRPDCPFKQLDARLIHTLGTKQFDTRVQLDIATTPGLFLASGIGQDVVPTTDSSNAQFATVIYRDLRGIELGKDRLRVKSSKSGEIEFNVEQLKADDECDATILFRREDGFVQQLVVPQLKPRSNPQGP